MSSRSRIPRGGPRGKNYAVIFGCLAFAGACGVIPLISTQIMKGEGNLINKDKPLTGSQIQRGPFLNSGSIDAGPDPDWKMRDGSYTYKGRKPDIKQ